MVGPATRLRHSSGSLDSRRSEGRYRRTWTSTNFCPSVSETRAVKLYVMKAGIFGFYENYAELS